MLRPQDTRDTRDQTARRHLELCSRPGWVRSRRGLVASATARRPTHAGAEQLQRRPGGPATPRACRRRLVPTPDLHPPRLGGATGGPPVRRGNPPRRRLDRRDLRRGARGWLHAVRSRRERSRQAGRAVPAHRRRQQRAHVGVHSARCRRGTGGRIPAPAAVPRLLQLRGPAPQCLVVHDAACAHSRPDGDDGHSRGRRRRPLCRGGRRRGDRLRCAYGSGMPRAHRSPRRRGPKERCR